MTPKIVKFLIAALLLGLSRLASANAIPIDIFDTSGIPGTGGSTSILGPCYCVEPAYLSPVMTLTPGDTYNFGEVRDYWVQSPPTPDGGPDQQNLYLLFAPDITSGAYPLDFQAPPFNFPSLALCDQDDTACNATYGSAYQDFSLIYTVPDGESATQVELVGHYDYTPPPVPEPLPVGMLVAGLALVAGVAKRRGRTH